MKSILRRMVESYDKNSLKFVTSVEYGSNCLVIITCRTLDVSYGMKQITPKYSIYSSAHIESGGYTTRPSGEESYDIVNLFSRESNGVTQDIYNRIKDRQGQNFADFIQQEVNKQRTKLELHNA
jgi:hypothetical protein